MEARASVCAARAGLCVLVVGSKRVLLQRFPSHSLFDIIPCIIPPMSGPPPPGPPPPPGISGMPDNSQRHEQRCVLLWYNGGRRGKKGRTKNGSEMCHWRMFANVNVQCIMTSLLDPGRMFCIMLCMPPPPPIPGIPPPPPPIPPIICAIIPALAMSATVSVSTTKSAGTISRSRRLDTVWSGSIAIV